MKYKIVLDDQKVLLENLPEIEAESPKAAAEKYAGCKVERSNKRYGEIVVENTVWPIKMFLYNRINQR